MWSHSRSTLRVGPPAPPTYTKTKALIFISTDSFLLSKHRYYSPNFRLDTKEHSFVSQCSNQLATIVSEPFFSSSTWVGTSVSTLVTGQTQDSTDGQTININNQSHSKRCCRSVMTQSMLFWNTNLHPLVSSV